ncbi:MAG: hypothetical protein ACLFVU_02235 [Phycisphaerae bacterium]
MTQSPPATHAAPAPAGLVRRNAAGMLTAAALTLIVSLGSYLLFLAMGSPLSHAAVGSLALTSFWIACCSGVFAITGTDGWAATMRVGACVDASIILLLVLWLSSIPIDLWDAVRMYLLWAAGGVTALAVVRMARSTWARATLALLVAGVSAIMLSSPFWIGGPLQSLSGDAAKTAAAWAVRANLFFAVSVLLAEPLSFSWPQSPLMYDITRLGDYVPIPSVGWYETLGLYLAIAVVAGTVAGVRSGAGRRRMSRSRLSPAERENPPADRRTGEPPSRGG